MFCVYWNVCLILILGYLLWKDEWNIDSNKPKLRLENKEVKFVGYNAHLNKGGTVKKLMSVNLAIFFFADKNNQFRFLV